MLHMYNIYYITHTHTIIAMKETKQNKGMGRDDSVSASYGIIRYDHSK